MKKLISVSLALGMLFCFASCKEKNPYENYSAEEFSSAVADENTDVYNFHCYYSNKNEDRTDDEILVSFPNDIYDAEKDEFYTENGDTKIVFYGDKVFFDKETNEVISEDELQIGQLLEVVYSGKAEAKNPAVIKAYKAYVIDKK